MSWSPLPVYWSRACEVLSKADDKIGAIVQWVDETRGPERHFEGAGAGGAYETLLRAMVGQQISVKAAQTIWNKFLVVCGGLDPPEVLARLNEFPRRFREDVGLSQRKILYMKDLSEHFITGRLNTTEWQSLDDEATIQRLCAVKGIGRWTAEMFLIFYLTRPDVYPLDDLGLMRAIGTHYPDSMAVPISKEAARLLGERWRPWRTVATWYLWRSLDPNPTGR